MECLIKHREPLTLNLPNCLQNTSNGSQYCISLTCLLFNMIKKAGSRIDSFGTRLLFFLISRHSGSDGVQLYIWRGEAVRARYWDRHS